MSLSLLLDYRPEDTKEHSFEVSLFAELFNEMLMRDFGFYIYKALRQVPEKPKEEKDDKKKKDDEKDKKKEEKKSSKDDKDKKDEKEKKEEKKSSKKDDDDEDDEDEDDDRRDRSKRSTDREREKRLKKDRPKLITVDPHLLLSFVYFDQTHCGYIFEKDIEDLLFTLGLQLSRAQVRKIVSKVITRDSLHYRKLTDKCKDDKDVITNTDSTKTDNNDCDTLALGNKGLLPIFQSPTLASNPETENSKNDADENKTIDKPAEGIFFYIYKVLTVNINESFVFLEFYVV